MRDIKFRCWIPSEQFMGVPFDPFEDDNDPDPYRRGHWPDDAVFLQYTGLKDKNGKEIYEGDIINSKFSDDKDCNHVIEWSDGHSGFTARFIPDINGSLFTQGWIDEFGKQVIGNIHQNPELLK